MIPMRTLIAPASSRGVRLAILLLLAAVATLTAACGRQGKGSEAGAPDPYPLGRCDVTITGDVQQTYTAGGSNAFASVYWMTDGELRDYFAWKAEVDNRTAPDDIPFYVDQAMSKNPRFVTFLLDCWQRDAIISLVPGRGSRYETIPHQPGSYEIAPVATVEDAIPGNFVAHTNLRVGNVTLRFLPTQPGKLVVTAFDAAHVAGTFTYKAAVGKRAISVDGSFDIRNPATVPKARASR